MRNLSNFKKEAPDDLKVIRLGDPLYQYARVISNTRFGHMPDLIAYCSTVNHVQFCIDFCNRNGQEFRIRSGGHQHEGMCSGNGVFIIDLSEMDTIDYIDADQAWIPVGKQLGKVYEELENRNQIIPGGGCQSVNVGGLTQGGGWGLSVRKFGMTCDSVLECEIVLADGSIAYPSPTNLPDLFWALKGGGGGNFGVITRFRFKLYSLKPVITSFSLLWKSKKDVLNALKIWTTIHAIPGKLDANLSTACGMMVADPEDVKLPEGQKSAVHARMGGQFYGSKIALLELLRKHFGTLIPDENCFVSLIEKRYPKETKRSVSELETDTISLARHQSYISDFVNPTTELFKQSTKSIDCGDRHYRILPEAPSSTCDRPHPHKVTSTFPIATTQEEHYTLVEKIYEVLAGTCFYSDVNRYMSFHCLGGAVRENSEKRVFAYHDKPYMLQIQCWWDDAGNAFTNESRNKAYVKWVENFRKEIDPQTEGAFINFIDYLLVPNANTPKGRLALLELYYGNENLKKLRAIKSIYDPENVFNFEMSIPLM